MSAEVPDKKCNLRDTGAINQLLTRGLGSADGSTWRELSLPSITVASGGWFVGEAWLIITLSSQPMKMTDSEAQCWASSHLTPRALLVESVLSPHIADSSRRVFHQGSVKLTRITSGVHEGKVVVSQTVFCDL